MSYTHAESMRGHVAIVTGAAQGVGKGVAIALLERGAIGLISTHDLALTEIVDTAQGGLVNVHFQDEIRDGRLYFDFKLHPGVVTKSNGIELMRSIGLDV